MPELNLQEFPQKFVDKILALVAQGKNPAMAEDLRRAFNVIKDAYMAPAWPTMSISKKDDNEIAKALSVITDGAFPEVVLLTVHDRVPPKLMDYQKTKTPWKTSYKTLCGHNQLERSVDRRIYKSASAIGSHLSTRLIRELYGAGTSWNNWLKALDAFDDFLMYLIATAYLDLRIEFQGLLKVIEVLPKAILLAQVGDKTYFLVAP